MVTVRIGNDAIIRTLAHRDARVNTGILNIVIRCTHLQDGHEEVNTGQGGTDTGELKRPNPVVNAHARTVLNSRQRRVGQPAGLSKFAHTQ